MSKKVVYYWWFGLFLILMLLLVSGTVVSAANGITGTWKTGTGSILTIEYKKLDSGEVVLVGNSYSEKCGNTKIININYNSGTKGFEFDSVNPCGNPDWSSHFYGNIYTYPDSEWLRGNGYPLSDSKSISGFEAERQ